MTFETEFRLDENIRNITSSRIKPILEESWLCFNHGLYRTSVTSIYTALIYDLLEKIEYLGSIEDIQSAKDFFTEIITDRKDNPQSPNWEKNLINGCCERLQFLTQSEREELLQLKNFRNKAAHPSFTFQEDSADIEIENISRETALWCIATAYRISFSKKAIIFKHNLQNFLTKSNQYYNEHNNEDYINLIQNVFFRKFTDESLKKLFKTLWKFTFKLDNEDCIKNRPSNRLSLQAIIKYDYSNFIRYINENRNELFSDLDYSLVRDFAEDGLTVQNFRLNTFESRIYSLIRLIQEFPEIWYGLDDEIRQNLRSANEKMFSSHDPLTQKYQGDGSETDSNKIQIRYICISPYLFISENRNYNDFITALKTIRKNYIPEGNFVDFSIYNFIAESDFILMLNQAKHYNSEQSFFRFFITHFGESVQWSQARFNYNLIKNYLHELSLSNQKLLIEKINSNNQIYDLNEIQDIISRISQEFNFTSMDDWKAICDNIDNIESEINYYFSDSQFSNIL